MSIDEARKAEELGTGAKTERLSHINGNGYGSDHAWRAGYTGYDRATPYHCVDCGAEFYHHYPSVPNIFEAMKLAGVPETCERKP